MYIYTRAIRGGYTLLITLSSSTALQILQQNQAYQIISMEGKGRVGSSGSLFSELFGTKEPQPASSSGSFASIFAPPSKLVGRNSQHDKHGSPGQSASHNMPSRDRNSVFTEERVEPCHLSSSLYYGGQDVYPRSQNSQTYPVFKKDRREEDDVNGNNLQDASRGNWWQGSLYY